MTVKMVKTLITGANRTRLNILRERLREAEFGHQLAVRKAHEEHVRLWNTVAELYPNLDPKKTQIDFVLEGNKLYLVHKEYSSKGAKKK